VLRAILPAPAWYFPLIGFRFVARSAEKRKQKEVDAVRELVERLPKAKDADCVSPAKQY
jgi:hypothetical protein